MMSSISATPSRPRGRGWRTALRWLLGVLVVLSIALIIAYHWLKYEPDQGALPYMQSSEQVSVTELKRWISFAPSGQSAEQNIIFYPGGLVEPESYAPLAFSLAEQGYRTFVVKMPLELAVLAQNRASEIIDLAPGETYVIGGHSLGGSMAARYAVSHPDAVAGVLFLASYADDKADLSNLGLQVLQITGSQDMVLNHETWDKSRANLPDDVQYIEIEGGTHAQFGTYGEQRGDGTPSISGGEQRRQMVEAITNWLAGFTGSD